jgi:ABC-type methionine transport system permease subunit
VAIIMLIGFVVGLPVAVVIFLVRNRDHIQKDAHFAIALGPLFEASRLVSFLHPPF